MNPALARLQEYPFARLSRLLAGVKGPVDLPAISLSIGEPQHPAPDFVLQALNSQVGLVSRYPTTRGLDSLRDAIAAWLMRRFDLPAGSIDPASQVLPVNGTREALFSFAQAVIDPSELPLVAMPNPFYQIYEGAALLAGARPHFLNCLEGHGYQPDFDAVDAATWRRCQLLYICSPGNPTGAVLDLATLGRLIELAQRYDFIIAADECYSEIYPEQGQPPPGLLQAAATMGLHDFRRCVVFHSLSKRSNVPGLRSGFVAGDRGILQSYFDYRTYHGCAMPLQVQLASQAAWEDERHVATNRRAYSEKFSAVMARLQGCLEVELPAAGFYLWPRTPFDDRQFARDLFARQHLTALPGSFLGRAVDGVNPGSGHLRLALVPPLADCCTAADRLRNFVEAAAQA